MEGQKMELFEPRQLYSTTLNVSSIYFVKIKLGIYIDGAKNWFKRTYLFFRTCLNIRNLEIFLYLNVI
jgi:hypothetical protein